MLPLAISLEADAIASVPARTSATMRVRLLFMCLSASIIWPVSSLPAASITLVRSPSATRRATPTASTSGPVMLRVARKATASEMPAAIKVSTRIDNSVREVTSAASLPARVISSFW